MACTYAGMTTHDDYVSNIADGCGENLPAILGLDSMIEKNVILILKKDQEAFIIPNGDFKVMIGNKARVAKMDRLPAGHLAMKCSDFHNSATSSKTGGNTGANTSITYMADTPDEQHMHHIGHMLPQEFYQTVKASVMDAMKKYEDEVDHLGKLDKTQLDQAMTKVITTLATETLEQYHTSKEFLPHGDVTAFLSTYEDPASLPVIPRGVPHFHIGDKQ